MLCVQCGFQNSDRDKCCAKCGAKLPQVMKGPTASCNPELGKVNERLQQFELAVQRVTDGEWNAQEFGLFLTEMSEILAEKENGIREIAIPEEAADEFREELAVGFAGIDSYNCGLSRMFEYLQNPDPKVLYDGLSLVREGNERINEAMRINRDNRAKLEEMGADSRAIL